MRENLKERFDKEDICNLFVIFEAKVIKKLPNEQIGGFGKEKLQKLLEHYAELINIDEAQREWRLAKITLKNMDFTSLIEEVIWSEFIDKHWEQFPNISTLVTIMHLIPMSTASCEKGFFTLKLIKTRLRNSLSR